MGKNKKYTNKFNLDWLKHGDYKSWLQAVESCDTLAYCKLCNNQFDVGSMRMSALTSHSKGAKHKTKAAAMGNSKVPSVFHFLSSSRAPNHSSPAAPDPKNSSMSLF